MRLDPVFVVEPKPAVPSMPTRRAFVFAGSTFALGVSVGGACGYAMGVSSGGARKENPLEPTNHAAEVLNPSGDVELDEMRRLAVKAPIEELTQHRLVFLDSFTRNYRRDEILWRGLQRLCDEILARPDYPDRRRTAIAVAQTVELGEPGLKKLVGAKIAALRAIR